MMSVTKTGAPEAKRRLPRHRRLVAYLPQRRSVWVYSVVAAIVLTVGGYVAVRLIAPLPAPRVVQTLPRQYTIPGTAPAVPWPRVGEATLEIEGLGGLGSSGGTKPVPIASIAKVMTAYLILRNHPMSVAENGATLTVTKAEADAYPSQLAAGQSLIQVVAGEALSERQALEALLLPSANNIAHILARWDAGNDAAFVAKMNDEATKLGMANTQYTDPSGLDPATVSTPGDQVILARKAMDIPALAQIVSMPQTTLPIVGEVKNVNTILGQDGVVGLKTGFTDQAGGCLLFAAAITVEGQTLRVLGAVLGVGTQTSDAFTSSRALIKASGALVHKYRVVHAGQQVATVRGPLGQHTTLAASRDVEVLGWPGLTYRIDTKATVPARVEAAVLVGTLNFTATGAPVATAVQTGGALPSGWWRRLTHL
jgi:serine-type D-Ala-D-Ala carboxypeptidase (penicillin-binding protein 5/6)